MVKKVYIVSNYGREYTAMFVNYGWKVVDDIKKADLVQFVGGEDIDPALYRHHKHPKSRCNPNRDKKEVLTYLMALKLKLPIAGICRGSQFLNVMNGGALWQHIEGHCGSHMATYTDIKMKKQIRVTSTHHQMIIPVNNNDDYMLLMVANEKGTREKMSPLDSPYKIIKINGLSRDIEALYYKRTKCLLFQPHPEFLGEKALADLYFRFIEMFLIK